MPPVLLVQQEPPVLLVLQELVDLVLPVQVVVLPCQQAVQPKGITTHYKDFMTIYCLLTHVGNHLQQLVLVLSVPGLLCPVHLDLLVLPVVVQLAGQTGPVVLLPELGPGLGQLGQQPGPEPELGPELAVAEVG